MRGIAIKSLLGFAGAAMLTSGAFAQIVSPDGRWAADLDANGTGQITNLFDNAQGGSDNVFETLWYERSIGTGGVTARVESTYTNTGSNIGANSASFDLSRNDGRMTMRVLVDMVDGANGGARFGIIWTNVSGDVERVQPYAYADLDVNGSAGGDFASFNGSSLVQSDGGVDIYFGSIQNIAPDWEIQTFAGLRNDLDAGRTGLTNSGGGGPGDFTSAISGAFTTLNSGESLAVTFQIGGEAITPAPGALALLGLAGLAAPRRRRR